MRAGRKSPAPRCCPSTSPSSAGEYNWGGLHGTSFWIDPEEDLIGIFMIQIYPNRDIEFRGQFKNLVYQALVN